jgi:hypothetical protein
LELPIRRLEADGALRKTFCIYLPDICSFLWFFAMRKWLISRVIPRYSTKFHSEKIKSFLNHRSRHAGRMNADGEFGQKSKVERVRAF